MKKQKALTFFILSFAFLLFHSESVAQNCKYDIWDVETGDWTVTESIKLRGEAATSFAFDAILGHSVFKGETNYHLITYLPTYLPESAFPPRKSGNFDTRRWPTNSTGVDPGWNQDRSIYHGRV
jgi:hypothetical protein